MLVLLIKIEILIIEPGNQQAKSFDFQPFNLGVFMIVRRYIKNNDLYVFPFQIEEKNKIRTIVTYKKDERGESAVDLVKCLAIEQMNTSEMIIIGVDVRYKVVYVESPEIKDAVADSIWNRQKSIY